MRPRGRDAAFARCAAPRARPWSPKNAPSWSAAMAGEAHPVPSRTRKLSPRAPMVLRSQSVGEQDAADQPGAFSRPGPRLWRSRVLRRGVTERRQCGGPVGCCYALPVFRSGPHLVGKQFRQAASPCSSCAEAKLVVMLGDVVGDQSVGLLVRQPVHFSDFRPHPPEERVHACVIVAVADQDRDCPSSISFPLSW